VALPIELTNDLGGSVLGAPTPVQKLASYPGTTSPTVHNVRQHRRARRGCPAEATIGVGLGANVLVGGSNQTVALQPVSVQGQVGLNLAVGFAELQLRFVH
jgi:hypothetical protein